MDPVGLINSINYAVDSIVHGRIARRTRGQTEQGLEAFEKDIALATDAFTEAVAFADPYLMLLAEYTFVIQELESGYPEEKEALASYRAAIADFDDAFRALEVVKVPSMYQGVEKAFPRKGDYRHDGCPKDAFHVAYIGHRVRLQNTLKQMDRSPGKVIPGKADTNLPHCSDSLYGLAKKRLWKNHRFKMLLCDLFFPVEQMRIKPLNTIAAFIEFMRA